MSLQSLFGTDKSKEIEGTWIDVTVNDDGTDCGFKVSRMSVHNRRFAAAIAKRQKKYGVKLKTMGQEKNQSDMIEVFVETVLVNWQNVVDFREGAQDNVVKGEPSVKIEYSRENAIWLLNQLPDLFELLVNESTELTNFQAEDDEEKVKN